MTNNTVTVTQALELAFALIDSIKQTSGNVWWVDVDDPETAVCDTHSALEAALATHRTNTAEREAIRMAYKTGYNEAYEDCRGTTDHDAAEEGWQQYLETLDGPLSQPEAGEA